MKKLLDTQLWAYVFLVWLSAANLFYFILMWITGDVQISEPNIGMRLVETLVCGSLLLFAMFACIKVTKQRTRR